MDFKHCGAFVKKRKSGLQIDHCKIKYCNHHTKQVFNEQGTFKPSGQEIAINRPKKGSKWKKKKKIGTLTKKNTSNKKLEENEQIFNIQLTKKSLVDREITNRPKVGP